jgi:hypothetical protein
MKSIEQLARENLDELEAGFNRQPEFTPVRARDYAYLDLDYYASRENDLTCLGFQLRGDFQDVSIHAVDKVFRPSFHRLLASPDLVTTAIISQRRLNLFHALVTFFFGRPKDYGAPTVDFGSRMSDGMFIQTYGTQETAHVTSPPNFVTTHLRAGTPAAQTLEQHLHTIRDYIAANPGAHPLPTALPEDPTRYLLESAQAKLAYHRQRGILSWEVYSANARDREALRPVYEAMLAEAARRRLADLPLTGSQSAED